MRELLAAYEKAEDLINIGAYQAGSNRRVDEAVARYEQMIGYLRQNREDAVAIADAIAHLLTVGAQKGNG
jgi:flagellar biosynthesis/type III secretory pathway ATPase